ncbi:MAG: hypothetical protein KGJ06_03560 [Pseudomonadota bacterium]|nr:hypothetical protein [Pseudomonadota bacterium]
MPDSIITEQQENRLTAYVDGLINQALTSRPRRSAYGSDADYNAAVRSYRNNWVTVAIDQERDNIRTREGITDEAQIDSVLRDRVGDPRHPNNDPHSLRNRIINGLRTGAGDPDAERRNQGAMEMLWSGDFKGAIQSFVRGIPIVGDILATVKELWRMVTSGEGFDIGKAWEHAKLRRAMGGAADALGLTGAQREQFVQEGVRQHDSGAAPAAVAPSVRVEGNAGRGSAPAAAVNQNALELHAVPEEAADRRQTDWIRVNTTQPDGSARQHHIYLRGTATGDSFQVTHIIFQHQDGSGRVIPLTPQEQRDFAGTMVDGRVAFNDSLKNRISSRVGALVSNPGSRLPAFNQLAMTMPAGISGGENAALTALPSYGGNNALPQMPGSGSPVLGA